MLAPARFAAALSRSADAAVATGEVLGQVLDRIGTAPDLAVLFVAGAHLAALDDVVEACQALVAPHVLLGVSARGVLAGAEEAEDGPALGLWAGQVGPVTPLRLDTLPGEPPILAGVPDELPAGGTLLVLADPHSFDVDGLLAVVDERAPTVRVVGGLASAGAGPGGNRLVLNEEVHDAGAVAVVLPAEVAATVVVSQGCRPIGPPWVVTAAEGRFLVELAGRPALERVTQALAELAPDQRRLAARGLHLGVVAHEHGVDEFRPGDFLVRAVLGADPARGVVAVDDAVDVGRVVQLQVRDDASADADLRRSLVGVAGAGALLFTCTGRGTQLFPVPHHDATVVSDALGVPLAGMFSDGELGPVGDHNALHTFTASLLVFA